MSNLTWMNKSGAILLMFMVFCVSCAERGEGETSEEIIQSSQALVLPDGGVDPISPPLSSIVPQQSPYEQFPEDIDWFPPSRTQVLPDGYHIDLRDEDGYPTDPEQYLGNETVIQKLAEGDPCDDFLVSVGVFHSLVARCETGFVLVDSGGHNGARPPSGGPGGQEMAHLLEALNTLAMDVGETLETLPIKVVVNGHNHIDHAGGSQVLKLLFPDARIIVSGQLYSHVKEYNFPIGLPDSRWDIVRKRVGPFAGFTFEGERFRFLTPATAAHSLADSIVISPNGTAFLVDAVGQVHRLSFIFNSVATNPEGVIYLLRVMLGEAGFDCDVTHPVTGDDCVAAGPANEPSWRVGIWGHFNVGYVDDVIKTLRYYADMQRTFYEVLYSIDLRNQQTPQIPSAPPPEVFIDPVHHHTVDIGLMGIFTGIADGMYEKLANEGYYDKLQFQTARGDCLNIVQSNFLNRLGSNDVAPPAFTIEGLQAAGRLPDYSPIPPGTIPVWGNHMQVRDFD